MRRRLAALAAVSLLAWFTPGASAQELAMVVNRIVYPGETVDAAALEQVKLRPTARVTTQVVREAEEAEGKVAKRTLLPGKLIPVSSLRDPYLVEAGKAVTVVYQNGGLMIRATAVPLQPASLGEMIRLRNADSGKVFSGIVMADGTVRVGG
jgi:flagella basal body P-ring formation protein FlgA